MSAYQHLHDDARTWIYQCNRELSDIEVEAIQQKGETFVRQWAAHGNDLQAAFFIKYHRFILLFADETHAAASGCSIDSSVHFIQRIEREYGIHLMDRMSLAYRSEDGIVTASMSAFEERIVAGKIHENTIVFNNLIQTKAGFMTRWEVPLKDSWHSRMLPVAG